MSSEAPRVQRFAPTPCLLDGPVPVPSSVHLVTAMRRGRRWEVTHLRRDGGAYYHETLTEDEFARTCFPSESEAWAALLTRTRAAVALLRRRLQRAEAELGELEQLVRYHQWRTTGQA